MSYNATMTKVIDLKSSMLALKSLDELLSVDVELLLGGGGAMILAHKFPLATSDLDAVAKGITTVDLDRLIKAVAEKHNLPKDWLNPYFSTFLFTLPQDYRDRLINVFKGRHLIVMALGATDMLILKCFAGRAKDVGHAKALIKAGADVSAVEAHLEQLKKNKIPKVDQALDFLDEVQELL